MDKVINFLQELVRIKSTSGDEEKLSKFINDRLRDLGFDDFFIDDLGNVVGKIGSGDPKIMFEAHMDNVGPGDVKNWKEDPYSGEIIDNEVYGRGSVDMKGAIASMIYGIRNAKRYIQDHDGSVYFVGVVHEETAEGAAIKHVIDNYVDPDYFVLGEPSGLDICIGHRGRAVIQIDTYGSTSHASMPDLGDNAAYSLIDILNEVRELELDEDDLLGEESCALVHISCEPGSGPVVPDKAKAILDFRIITETTEEDLQKKIESIALDKGLDADVSTVSEKLRCFTGEEIIVDYFFPGWITEDKEFISSVEKSVNFIDDLEVRAWTFSTDGVYTAGERDIPTIGFGPGDEEKAHQPDESIEVEEINEAVEGYEEIIKNLLG